MPTPRKNLSDQIPNQPFNSPEVSEIKGPYWNMPLGNGLESDPYGSVQISGSNPVEPQQVLYGSNGWVGIGAGLEIGSDGYFQKQGNQYIYCTSQFPQLPVSYPPYNCETEVNTTGVTDFTEAWYDCVAITEFPCVDSSAVTDFSYAWYGCESLATFPSINTSAGENFTYSWAYSGLTTFPIINTSNGTDFSYALYYCESLTTFPNIDTSKGTNFGASWQVCTSLTTFPPLNTSKGTDFRDAW